MKFLLTFLFSVSVFSADVKMGMINIQKILEQTKEGKRIHSQLKKTFDQKSKELKNEEAKLKKKGEAYQKKASLLSAQARVKEERALQQGFATFNQKMTSYQKEISTKEANLKKPILEKIKKVVDAVSKEQNVDFTIEISASPVVYVKNKIDITDKVIKAYDKKHK